MSHIIKKESEMNETIIIILGIILILLNIQSIWSAFNNHKVINNNKEICKREKHYAEKHVIFMETHEKFLQQHELRIIKLNTEIEVLKKMLKNTY